ncbi:hypothetical protein AGRA3207_003465 [Actinomadura graeca]|uniref:Secreted protein n=1 Tax=Actinomadura graeca TaxID=2750812 RepID=A0ABX8QWV5_9ACTN|nr:hypothetical protein [Actinomadura graeca]QXJ22464.1 hypothetical protein AGRA3207_003465 [Actinomadura graeca]
MRHIPRLVGSLAVAAIAVTGLMSNPAAHADTPAGEAAAPAVVAGSLYAWRGEPIGPPDQIFEGFDCQATNYRFSHWQVVSEGPPELWMAFADPGCEEPIGFFRSRGEPETRFGVGSVQRWR